MGEEAIDGETVPPSLPKERYDLRILSSLRRIVRSIDSHSKQLATASGMTVPQLLCMMKLDELGPLTVKGLSEELFLSPSTMVGIVDRLERAGVVARQRSVQDRRKVHVKLTEVGLRMLAMAPSPLQAELVEAIDKLPELERATIALALEKLISCIESPERTADSLPTAPILAPSADLKSGGDIAPPAS